MKLRYGLLVALLCVSNSPAVAADDDGDKLDAILKEIRSLTQRVNRIEEQLRKLTAAQPVQDLGTKQTPTVPAQPRVLLPIKRPIDAKEVIRLQSESPGSLIKGLHERERQLRQRPFPPEVFPQPVLIIPQP